MRIITRIVEDEFYDSRNLKGHSTIGADQPAARDGSETILPFKITVSTHLDPNA